MPLLSQLILLLAAAGTALAASTVDSSSDNLAARDRCRQPGLFFCNGQDIFGCDHTRNGAYVRTCPGAEMCFIRGDGSPYCAREGGPGLKARAVDESNDELNARDVTCKIPGRLFCDGQGVFNCDHTRKAVHQWSCPLGEKCYIRGDGVPVCG